MSTGDQSTRRRGESLRSVLTLIDENVRAWFLDPFEILPSIEEARKVRLLAGVLLAVLLATVVGRLFFMNLPIWMLPLFGLLYLIGRTRLYQPIAVIAAFFLFLPSYFRIISESVYSPEIISAAFIWQLVPIIFCVLILNIRWLIFLLGANFTAMVLIPQLTPGLEYSDLFESLAIVIWVSIALVIVHQARDRLEHDRQQSLVDSEAKYRNLTEQLAILYEISRAVSNLQDLPQVLEVIFQQVKRILHFDTFIISLYQKEEGRLYFPFLYDDGRQWVETPIHVPEDTRFAEILQNRKPLLINRSIKENLGFKSRLDASSIMIVPMRLGEDAIGSITVQSYTPQPYTQEHLDLMVGVAYLAATAIENANLYKALQREVQDLNQAEILLRDQSEKAQALAHLSSLIVSEQREFAGTLQEVARYISNLFGDLCAIQLLSNNAEYLELSAIAAPNPDIFDDLAKGQKQPGQMVDLAYNTAILRNGQPVVVTKFDPEEAVNLSPSMRDHFTRFPVSSMLIVPLRAQSQLLGMMNLWRYQPGNPYQETDVVFFTDLADRVALGIINSSLYQALQNELVERTRAEAEVRTLNAELEQRVRERTVQLQVAIQELESFAYSVSHDLRAPLRAINGYSSALEEEYQNILDESALSYLDRIRIATQRMSGLIDDLLSLSRITRSEMHIQEVDLVKIASDSLNILRQQHPERKVEFITPSKMIVRADLNLMRVALENLIGNAWKFTSKHAAARIELGERFDSDSRVYFIRDDGAGFDMNYVDRLFIEFQRLHSPDAFEGTGIGLVIVRRIINRHGGTIWAEGEIEQGATFYFSLGT
jgi:signal transduction histidine kinase